MARVSNMLQRGGGNQRALFINHVLLIVLFLAYLQPLSSGISRAAYLQFLLVAIVSYLLKVVLRFGVPSLKPFPAAIKSWLMQASATTDFQYAILCAPFVGARPVTLVCIPTVVLAVYHAFAYASTHFSGTPLWQQYGQPIYRVLVSRQRDAQLLNAGAEIGLGFLTVLKLFTRDRNFILPFLVWQILRTRYHTPDCASSHRQVWALLGQQARPLLDRVPALQTPLGYVERWFCDPR